MRNIQESVKNFYNAQAQKFSWTRKKNWSEFFYIKEQVEKYLKISEKIKILELWCWDGRLYRYLIEYFPQERIEYVWVDISEWLIQIAKTELQKEDNCHTEFSSASQRSKEIPDQVLDDKKISLEWKINKLENTQKNHQVKFVVSDMLSFLEKQEQQNFDMVIAVASFQHISTKWERLLIMKNIYRILNYDGVVLMFNWSFSKWFFKKYTKNIIKSLLIWILSLWTKAINDIYIPWKNNNSKKVFYRYYHIFFLYELRYLFKKSWFIIQEDCYINKKWEKSISRIDSRNSIFLWKKNVLK